MKALVARWTTNEDATFGPPDHVEWADGTPATHADYRKHLSDTHTWVIDLPDGIERHIFPDVIADIRYDALTKAWRVSASGVISAALDLPDPNAVDDQILAELYTFPMIYRARIHR